MLGLLALSRGKCEYGKSLVRLRKPSISQLHSPNKRVESPGSETHTFSVPPFPPGSLTGASATPTRPCLATVIAFESPMNATLCKQYTRPSTTAAGLRTLPATSRHSYAGPDTPFLRKSGEGGIGGLHSSASVCQITTLQYETQFAL